MRVCVCACGCVCVCVCVCVRVCVCVCVSLCIYTYKGFLMKLAECIYLMSTVGDHNLGTKKWSPTIHGAYCPDTRHYQDMRFLQENPHRIPGTDS